MFRKFSLVFLMLGSTAMADTPAVMTDIPAIHSLVSKVMLGVGSPDVLLERGSSPHSFQLTPSQARVMSQADLLIWLGPDLTPWLKRAISGIGLSGEQIRLLETEGTILRQFTGGKKHKSDDSHGHKHTGHKHTGLDPHAWLDPKNAAVWLDVIAEELAKSDPENAAKYRANAANAKTGIMTLIDETKLALVPIQDRPIVVFHDAYGYFADRFGLKIGGAIRDGDAVAPGAAHLTGLQAKISGGHIACAFADVGHDPALLSAMFDGTDIPTGKLDPTGSSLEYGPDLYRDLIRNLATELMICADNTRETD